MMSDIDYYSSMEEMVEDHHDYGSTRMDMEDMDLYDNVDYMSMVDMEHYIDDSVEYDMVVHDINSAQSNMDDSTAHIVDTMHDKVDKLYTMPYKSTTSEMAWPTFAQGTTYFDSSSSSHLIRPRFAQGATYFDSRSSSHLRRPRFAQGATYFDSSSSSHLRRCHHNKRAFAHHDT
jgi:hypothetical protein